jgi:hypothetical protein
MMIVEKADKERAGLAMGAKQARFGRLECGQDAAHSASDNELVNSRSTNRLLSAGRTKESGVN